MQRLVLPLEGGITGVVGPNGCGKSNIVDAIRWVLGETKASSLRGASLEDVIFNGTDTLRPLGLAEVTLTLRANNENFFEDLTSPQLEVDSVLKNLEEEVKKNQNELLGGNALQLKVIEGKIDTHDQDSSDDITTTIISMDGEKIADLDDEIAQDEASEAEPVSTSLLTRFSWLKSVSEVQITRRLYRSGESEFFINRVACRLKDIKDFLRAIGLGARAYTIVAQGEVSRIVTSKPEERRSIIEEAAGVVGFKDKIAASNRKLDDTEHNLARLSDVISEVERQVASLKKQAARAESRQALKDEIERLEILVWKEKVSRFSGRLSGAQNNKNQFATIISDASTKISAYDLQDQSLKNEAIVFDTQADELRLQIDMCQEELLARARTRSEKQNKISEIRAFNMARVTEIKRLEERLLVLNQRLSEADTGAVELKQRETTLQDQIQAVQPVSEEDLKNAALSLRQKREELRTKESEIRSIRDKVVSCQSSIKAMQDQIIAASPLSQLKKTLSADIVGGLIDKVSVFTEGLVVPSKYTKAVQSVLSEKAAFLVAENPQSIGNAFLERINNKNSNNDKGAGIGILKKGSAVKTQKDPAIPFTYLLDVIEVKNEFSAAAVSLLSNIYVAEDSTQAFSFFQDSKIEPSLKTQLIIVTLDGEIHTDVSFFSLRHDGGLIQVQAKVRELQSDLITLEKTQLDLTDQKDVIAADVVTLETRQAELIRESEEKQKILRELTTTLASLRGRLQAESKQVEQLHSDIEKTTSAVKEVERKIEEAKKEEALLVEAAGNEDKDRETYLESQVKTLNDSLKEVDLKRKDFRQKLSEISNALRELQKQMDSATASLNQSELELQKIDLEKQHIQERVVQEYGEQKLGDVFAIESGYQSIADELLKEHEQEALKIRSRIAREGEVDSSSIERYQEEKTRLEELLQQRNDLGDACQVLKKTIARLEEVSKYRFISMFNSVSKNFSRLIPQLFGGGKGSLVLSDPNKPLESGVDILMRPPGKKPKSIDLLSGGEKALCATALIFSIFLEKPSPICVLDEVDAPLDEANLIRFLTLVQQMSVKTQFLLVTHNKRSMVTADHLIGVTQQQPGTSTVISVSLQDALAVADDESGITKKAAVG